jgi:hypothetical protein
MIYTLSLRVKLQVDIQQTIAFSSSGMRMMSHSIPKKMIL